MQHILSAKKGIRERTSLWGKDVVENIYANDADADFFFFELALKF